MEKVESTLQEQVRFVIRQELAKQMFKGRMPSLSAMARRIGWKPQEVDAFLDGKPVRHLRQISDLFLALGGEPRLTPHPVVPPSLMWITPTAPLVCSTSRLGLRCLSPTGFTLVSVGPFVARCSCGARYEFEVGRV
jgi:hypothetical protein